jgi:hypothetical protein
MDTWRDRGTVRMGISVRLAYCMEAGNGLMWRIRLLDRLTDEIEIDRGKGKASKREHRLVMR